MGVSSASSIVEILSTESSNPTQVAAVPAFVASDNDFSFDDVSMAYKNTFWDLSMSTGVCLMRSHSDPCLSKSKVLGCLDKIAKVEWDSTSLMSAASAYSKVSG